MDFKDRESVLDLIRSEIKKSKKKINKIGHKNKKNENKLMKNIYKNIKNYEKSILEEKLEQLHYINFLYDYLENSIDKKHKKKILFQQTNLNKLRTKLKKEIKKYLVNIK